jgi:hypothetical protein
MKIKPSYIIITVALIALGILWVRGFWFTEVFRTHKANEPNRAALLRLHEATRLGVSYAEVLTNYWHHRTDELRLFAENPSQWVIKMPTEFDTRQWKLLIDFTNREVRTVRIRTADGPTLKDGPKDKE